MAKEEIVFQLLEEERKARIERIAREKRITTEDCLVIGILRLNREIAGMDKRITGMDKKIAEMDRKITEMDRRINQRMESFFRWTVGLILGMWGTIIVMLIPILLKLVGMI